MIHGYPADAYENDLPEEFDPNPERKWDAEGQRWFAEFIERARARTEEAQAQRRNGGA